MHNAPKLKLAGVVSGYGPISIIKDVNLELHAGEIFALMGKNGMGKTTLVKTILGLVRMASGTIEMDGCSVVGVSPTRLRASGVGYAPQEKPLFQDLSIRDNLRLALPSDKELPAAVDRISLHFPVLGDRLSQKAGTLSGGEQKMLILARALMLKPKLLLIDEITEGLQPSVIDRIGAVLRHERDKNGTTVLLVEQHLDYALSVADRWAVLKLGSIDDEGLNGSDARARILEHLSL